MPSHFERRAKNVSFNIRSFGPASIPLRKSWTDQSTIRFEWSSRSNGQPAHCLVQMLITSFTLPACLSPCSTITSVQIASPIISRRHPRPLPQPPQDTPQTHQRYTPSMRMPRTHARAISIAPAYRVQECARCVFGRFIGVGAPHC